MAKTIVPFSYNEIYQGIAEKFLEKGYDIPYEGSNTAILTSILAYLGQAINFNTALNINESLLTLAKKRENVIQDARILSYEPKAKISTQLKLNLKVTKAGYITIKKYQKFTLNGYDFYYLGEDFQKYYDESQVNSTFEIIVKEGILAKYSDYTDVLVYTLDEEYEYIDIPFDDIENDGLFVTVDTFDDYGNKQYGIQYTKKDFNLVDVTDTYKNVYFRKDDLESGNGRIYFTLGGFGTKLKSGSTIYVDVLRSNGSEANATTYSGSIDGELSQKCTIVSSGSLAPEIYVYGQDEESIESIKDNAPLFYNTAGRCITAYDYKAFLKSNNSILDGLVWGGEDELVTSVGRVFYCCIPNVTEPDFEVQSISDGNYVSSGSYNANSSYDDLAILRKMDYKSNLFLGDGNFVGTNGIIDTIAEYNPPGLINYVKNPFYIFADVSIDVKKYEYGSIESEVNQKIFNTVKAYFDDRKGFETNFVESTLIRDVSNLLGSENGFDLDTNFSIALLEKNEVQSISKDFNYNGNIILYETISDSEAFNINFYLNGNSLNGDTLKVTLNREVEYNNENTKSIEYKITNSDLLSTYINIPTLIPNELNLSATWRNYNQTSEIQAQEAPLNFTKTYYTCEIRNQVFSINALLMPNQVAGQQYDLFYEKDGILTKVSTDKDQYLTQSDINSGEINVTIVDKNADKFPEITNPDSVIIKFQYTQNGEKFYYDSVRCDTIDEAKTALENDKTHIYDNLDTSELFMTNTKNADGTFRIVFYLPDYCQANDTISVETDGASQLLTLTETDIQTGRIEFDLSVNEVKIQTIDYSSKADHVMSILPREEFESSNLITEADDRIQFSSSGSIENAIPYTPTVTYDGKIKFKDSYSCVFYKNQENSFDIRNLIQNYGSGDTLNSQGQNLNTTLTVEVISSNSSFQTSYEFPYIKCVDPSSLGFLTVSCTLQVQGSSGGVYTKSFQIPIQEADVDTSALSEGIGGIYINLDLPPEGIYNDDGTLNKDNLPRFYAIFITANSETYNISGLHSDVKTVNSIEDTLDAIVYVDFDTETISKLPNIYPYFINEENLNAANTYKYLRFPIYYKKSTEEAVQIGTYIIVNGNNPYIRIKLRNSTIGLLENAEFELVYPSANFNLIKNGVLRLRSVNINTPTENYEFRHYLENEGIISEEFFQTFDDYTQE